MRDSDLKGVKVLEKGGAGGERLILADACVLTTGTFLNGRIKLGDQTFQGGRYLRKSTGWEPPTNKISTLFEDYEIERSKPHQLTNFKIGEKIKFFSTKQTKIIQKRHFFS